MKRRTGLRQLAVLTGLACTSSLSHALVITDTTNFNLSTATASTGYLDSAYSTSTTYSGYFNLDGFDSNLGILTGVSVYYDTTAKLAANFSVRDPSTCSIFCEDNVRGYGAASSYYSIDMISPNLGNNPSASDSIALNCSDNDGYCSDAGVDYLNYLDGLLFTTSNTSLLNSFLDNPLTFFVQNRTTASITACYDSEDLCQTTSNSDFWGSLRVQYTYEQNAPTDVPEPATLSLFGLGLIGLNLLRRKQRT